MMAGAGYKLFNSGDVLTAAQVNTYLQEQAVMRFANAAARTTALSGVLAEGMMSYLDDTNAVEVYNGSAWVSISSDQTPLTTKGDLFTYSTTDARLGVGANGETLVADSSTTTGLRWQSMPISQPVINGAMDVWQRGTTLSSITSAGYTADRWYFTTASGSRSVSRQSTNDTTNLPFIQYCMRLQRNSGNATTTALETWSSIETSNSIPYAGRTVTLSFYARKGADYSQASSLLTYYLASGTGTDQNLNAYTGTAYPIASTNITLTTTWQRFTATGSVGATATELAVYFSTGTLSGTASTNDYVEITGVQIDFGSTALPFRRSGGTLAGELAACQRYYYLHTTGNQVAICLFSNYSATEAVGYINFPVSMRTAPTLSMASGTNYYAFERNSGTDYINAATIGYAGVNTCRLINTTEISGTAGHSGILKNDNAASSVAFSAEL